MQDSQEAITGDSHAAPFRQMEQSFSAVGWISTKDPVIIMLQVDHIKHCYRHWQFSLSIVPSMKEAYHLNFLDQNTMLPPQHARDEHKSFMCFFFDLRKFSHSFLNEYHVYGSIFDSLHCSVLSSELQKQERTFV